MVDLIKYLKKTKRNEVNVERVEALITAAIADESLCVADADGATALHIAAKRGLSVRVLEALCEGGGARLIESQDTIQARTPLIMASQHGRNEAVRVLLQFNANVNAKTSDFEWTPLLCAAANNFETIVRLLLAHGASPFARDLNTNQLPIDCCGGDAIREMLLSSMAAEIAARRVYRSALLCFALRSLPVLGDPYLLQRIVAALVELRGKELEIYYEKSVLSSKKAVHRCNVLGALPPDAFHRLCTAAFVKKSIRAQRMSSIMHNNLLPENNNCTIMFYLYSIARFKLVTDLFFAYT